MNHDQLNRLFDLAGRTAIVTGGTRGIGLAIAEAYTCAGANVVVASRKAEATKATAQHLQSLGGNAIGVPTHAGDLDALATLVQRTVAEFGGVDIVVNGAANPVTQPLGQMTPQAWAKSQDVNVRGPLFLVQEALPHLTASSHAAVLNIISVGAFMFAPKVAMYAAGKAALMSLTRSMAAEYASRGIRVNALAPGSVDTDMVRNNTPEAVEAMRVGSFQQRLATPEEMVGPALLLTSDAGSYVTGQVLIADGGMVAH
ncbi:SDR family oxidoreductase [Rhodococcus sp. X156]|uniref:SDR family NAD(P)-dependent oxidoreductase n=1 Tax=Rhodococcus sp. X156 TaxID=2499145 RepID=UPI000FDA772B|nr:SDR family oxidoreductase [Rhodococcus sp. X156]